MTNPIKTSVQTTSTTSSTKQQLSESEVKTMKYLYKELKDSPGLSAHSKTILRDPGQVGSYAEQLHALADAKLCIRKEVGITEQKPEPKPKEPVKQVATADTQTISLSAEQKKEMGTLASQLKGNPAVDSGLLTILEGKGTVGTLEQQVKAIETAKLYTSTPSQTLQKAASQPSLPTTSSIQEKCRTARSYSTLNILAKRFSQPLARKNSNASSEEEYVTFARFRLSRMTPNSPEAKKLSAEIKAVNTDLMAKNHLQSDYTDSTMCKAMMLVFNTDALKNQNPHLGNLKYFKEISVTTRDIEVISNHLDKEIAKLQSPEKEVAKNRKAEFMEMMNLAQVLKSDGCETAIILRLINRRLEAKQVGMFDDAPKILKFNSQSSTPEEVERAKLEGVLVDDKGKEFGNLRKSRDPSSVMNKVQKFCNEPGHGNYKFLEGWISQQSAGSWTPRSCAIKYVLSEFRTFPENTFMGVPNEEKGWQSVNEENFNKFLKDNNLTKEDIEETIITMMAINMEMFSHLEEFPGLDKEKGTLAIFRTESDFVKNLIDENGINTPQAHYSSGSAMAPVVAEGRHAYQYDMPLHRCAMGPNYLLCGMYNDYEKEFLCDFSRIPAKYLGELENQGISSQPTLRGAGWSTVIEEAKEALTREPNPEDPLEVEKFQDLKDFVSLNGAINNIKAATAALNEYRAS